MLDTHLGRGGFEFRGPWGVSVALNITHHEDGLAGYSDAELRTMITRGERPDGTKMMPPMPYQHYAASDPADIDAIILYLRSLPAMPDL